MKNKEVEFISFNFNSRVLTVIGNDLLIEGNCFYEDETDTECVLKINKNLWIKEVFKPFVEQKAGYYDRYNYFCGVEFITADEFRKVGETNLEVGFDDEKEEYIYKNVPVFKAKSINLEMEHG